MNKTAQRAIFGAAFGFLASVSANGAEDCAKLTASVKEAIATKPSDLLSIVERNVAAHSTCACEVVKAAIEASQANADTVASIVQTASTAAPDQMRLIAQCSLAAAPDAITSVQAVIAKLDPGTGGGSYSAKEDTDYLWAKNTRLGRAVPTDSAEHYKVVDTNGVYLGDLNAKEGIDTRVRATATGGGSTWVYTARVPVPGEGWIKVAGGYLALRSADNLDFYLQSIDEEFNPLNFPGQGAVNFGPPGTRPPGGLLPPGPGAGFPPILEPPSSTETEFSNPT
ncbi:hypothetical protein [Luteolibacter sp. LG18]|uniref:hypothetical protein n=1 Tax=Luteolibacter sp. LG18 TaxID=2819286 RepID=UPI002B2A71B0|nr:hypothetical protein llg_16720 [Luteolibacter sp. LG18]